MKVLIVDDEPRARSRLARMLRTMKCIEICAEASDGAQALEAIEREKPEVVLLDVQMPGLDGFEVITEIRGQVVPLIIFVTAFDKYALRAFEVSAVDYLLKPISEERLQQALAKADKILRSDRSAATTAEQQLQRLVAAIEADRSTHLDRVVARRGQKFTIIPVCDIQAFLSEDELVFAALTQGRVLVNRTLKELESQLDPGQFVRVHKQTIINISQIAELEPLGSGGAVAKLKSGLNVCISRRYALSFKEKLRW